jgi:hypothetical protein
MVMRKKKVVAILQSHRFPTNISSICQQVSVCEKGNVINGDKILR